MVSGGTYGIEDVVHGAGYGRAILILLLTPILWSLPTAYMIGELSSALPQEGGFYAWVRRAMGDFWGFQEAWLSLVASVFDMAIYPTLFVLYLSRLFPWFGVNNRGIVVGLVVVIACAAMNIAGIRVVATTSIWLFFLLSAPFVAIALIAPFKYGALANAVTTPTTSHVDIIGGLLIAMWNYMGWDNASTIAAEVKQPQRTYPRAMMASVALVSLTYIVPVAAVALTKLSPTAWETGSWADIAGLLGGPLLRVALVLGGMMSAFGMFNALVMSYSRLPLAMAQDGMLPRNLQESHQAQRRSLGSDSGTGHRLGVVARAGLRAAGDDRYPAVWLELVVGVHRTDRAAHQGTQSPSAVQSSGRPVRSSLHRGLSHAAAGIFGCTRRP